MSDTRYRPTFNDTARPLPFQMRLARWIEGEGDGSAPAGDSAEGATDKGQQEHQSFTQADVDKLMAKVRAEEKRKASERFADYDTLKAKAEGAKTAEDRIAELEQRYAAAETRALRSSIAAEFSITADDRDLFLTGDDETTLRAQAQRLADRDSERKKRNNHVPGEGNNPRPADDKDALARAFFGLT